MGDWVKVVQFAMRMKNALCLVAGWVNQSFNVEYDVSYRLFSVMTFIRLETFLFIN